MKNLTLLLISTLAIACQPNKKNANTVAAVAVYERPDHHSELITKVFDAHGGYEQWSKMKTLSYTKGDEATITDLQSRKIRLETPKQTIGFDGENVWVTPDSVDASRARFYHNLYFYFYAMPFVVGDPGVFYEDVESMEIKGKLFDGIKISYGNGIGDSPKDNYILWIDPETNKMSWLMYTVTFKSGEASESYNLIRYSDWSEFNRLILPTKLEWYTYTDGVIGAQRSEAIFENIELSEMVPLETLFEMPESAQIAPLPTK
jgi:hypothetical protein